MADLLKYKMTQTESLVPDARNARKHSEEQVAKLAEIIKEFGFINPVIVDKAKGIIAGHGRVLAAKRLGLLEVPTLEAGHLTPNQRRAYMLADNKITLNAEWDTQLLRVELKDLKEIGFANLTGFSESEVQDLLFSKSDGLTDPDEVPDLSEEAITKPGDVWILGKHRVICGDSTNPETVEKLLGTVKPPLMVTDPPYGVNYDPNWRNEPHKLNLKSKTAMRSRTAAKGKVKNDDRADWTEAWKLFAGNVAYVWCGERQSADMFRQLKDSGFEPRNLIVWGKSSLVISRGHYHPQHETCWYAVRKGATANWRGGRKQSTLWKIDKQAKNETGHGTQKPVECMQRAIANNSAEGGGIYDPFIGSGTTLIAAETLRRVCYGIEISPQYVDVTVRRWQAFTGKKAKLESNGAAFA